MQISEDKIIRLLDKLILYLRAEGKRKPARRVGSSTT
jgi:hypothetical protein